MNRNSLPRKNLFDIVLENSKTQAKVKETSSDEKTPSNPNFLAAIGFLSAPFFYALVLYLALSTVSKKFSIQDFTYWETLKLYLGIWVISALFKRK